MITPATQRLMDAAEPFTRLIDSQPGDYAMADSDPDWGVPAYATYNED
jgi:hypothetical protein